MTLWLKIIYFIHSWSMMWLRKAAASRGNGKRGETYASSTMIGDINSRQGKNITFIKCKFTVLKVRLIIFIVINYIWPNMHEMHTFCCSLPENILSLTATSNSLTQKYIYLIQSTFTSVDTQPFASKGIL